MSFISIKDFTTGVAAKLRTFLVNTDENVTVHGLVDSANGEILGTKTEAKSTATDATSVSFMQVLKQISASVQAALAARWLAGSGVGFTWTTIFSTDLNSLASTNALLQAADILNGTALDKFMDLSLTLGSLTPVGAGANISVHLYPLHDAGAAYGDGRFTAAAAGPVSYPPVAVIPLVVVAQAQTGVAVGIPIPPGTFRLVVCNNAGVALNATGNVLKYRTYN